MWFEMTPTRPPFGGRPPPFRGRLQVDAGEDPMEVRVRALTAALMTIVMVAIVTFVATWLALGLDPDFPRQWAKAFVVAWPIAAVTAFFVMPGARKIAERLAGR